MNPNKPGAPALLLGAACLAAFGAAVAVSSCSSGPQFSPIVLDASKETPAPGVTPTVLPPPSAALGVAEPPPATPAGPARATEKTQNASRPVPIATAVPAPSAAEPPGALIAKHRQALDRGDVDGALAMWAPDAAIEIDGASAGRDAIRRWLAEQSASKAPAGDRDRVESGANVAERLGGGGLAIYEVRGGRIVRVRILR